MRWFSVALLLALGVALVALALRDEAGGSDGPASHAPVASRDSDEGPELAATRPVPKDEVSPSGEFDRLVDALRSDDEAVSGVAVERLRELLRTRAFSPAELLRLSFLPEGTGAAEACRLRALERLDTGDVPLRTIVPTLLDAAVSDDAHVRTVAARILGWHGSQRASYKRMFAAIEAGRGQDDVERLLRPGDFDAVARVLASDTAPLGAKRGLVLSLAGLGERGVELLPSVERFLYDEAEAIRERKDEDARRGIWRSGGEGSAVEIGVRLAELGPPAVGALIELLREPGWSMGRAAEIALERMGEPAVPALVRAIDASDLVVRRRAVNALADMETTHPGVSEALRRARSDDDPRVRASAARGLAARGGMEVVLSQLRSDEASVRWAAVGGLHGREALRAALSDDVVAALLALSSELSLGQWYEYAGLMETLGPRGAPAVPHLLDCLRGERSPRTLTPRPEKVFSAIGPVGVPHLLRALTDEDDRRAEIAADAITSISVADTAARDALSAHLEAHPDSPHRAAIAMSLARDGETRLLPILVRELEGGDWNRRSLAAEGIGRLGAPGLPHLEDLAQLLADLDAEFERRRSSGWWSASFTYQVRVDRAVQRLGAHDLPRMVRWLSHPCGDVVSVASETLDAGGAPAVTALREQTEHPDPAVRTRIRSLLGALENR